jgi:Ras homolog gene family, member A
VPTIFENYVADVQVDGIHVELALWDTSGIEDYDNLRPLSYPDAHVVLICFAISSPDSLDNVQEKVSLVSIWYLEFTYLSQWISEVLNFCPAAPIILVGLKKDLRYDPKEIEELLKTGQSPVTYEQVFASYIAPLRALLTVG